MYQLTLFDTMDEWSRKRLVVTPNKTLSVTDFGIWYGYKTFASYYPYTVYCSGFRNLEDVIVYYNLSVAAMESREGVQFPRSSLFVISDGTDVWLRNVRYCQEDGQLRYDRIFACKVDRELEQEYPVSKRVIHDLAG